MPSLRLAFIVPLLLASSALAQNAPMAVARATVQSVAADGASVAVKTRGGEDRTIRLNPKTRFVLVAPATLADVKPGTFIGVAAMPGANGEQKAMDVHIFPEAMRGTGEGYPPLRPRAGQHHDQRQYRRACGRHERAELTVTYKGGQQTIVVDPKTPIVAFEPGAKDSLKPGAAIIARGAKADDGSIDAAFVLIGKDELVPPL